MKKHKKSRSKVHHHKLAWDMVLHDVEIPRSLGMVLVLSFLLIILSIMMMNA